MFIIYSLLIVIVGSFVVAFIVDLTKKPQRDAAKKRQAEEERLEKENEEKKVLIDFYNKVNESIEGITKENAKEHRSSLEIINDNFHFFDSSTDVVAAYYRACDSYAQDKQQKDYALQQAELARKQKEHNVYIKGLTDTIANQKEVADLVGRDKYLAVLDKRLKEIKKKKSDLARAQAAMTQLSGMIGASGVSTPSSNRSTLDWKQSALAGAATAIGGPLAGIMVIQDSMAQNSANNTTNVDRKEAYRQQSEWVNKTLSPAMVAADEQLSKLNENEIANKIEAFDLLVDAKNIEEKLKDVNSTILSSKVKTPYEIYVDIEFSANEAEIIGKPAKVDGSFYVSVRDEGNEVAYGFISGEGYGITDIDAIGFGNKKYRLMCYSPSGNLDKDKEYNIVLQPKNIWYVENRKIDL